MPLYTKEVIKATQALLILVGCDTDGSLIADGVWGDTSKKAMRIYQQLKNIETTGEINRTTLGYMRDDMTLR